MYFKTPPLQFIDHPADASHKGGFEPRHIESIWAHATVGTNSLAWLSTTPGSNASAHRLIRKDGTIIKLVDDSIAAWTEGPADWFYPAGVKCNPNQVGLSVELENLNTGFDPYPLSQVQSFAKQVIEWRGLYGEIPLVQHRQLQQNKTDPAGFPWALFNAVYYHYLRNILNTGSWT